jgi:hypothetical protein
MGTDQIMYCVVALILGMLLANMLKNVCGCKKVVEGSSDFLECGTTTNNTESACNDTEGCVWRWGKVDYDDGRKSEEVTMQCLPKLPCDKLRTSDECYSNIGPGNCRWYGVSYGLGKGNSTTVGSCKIDSKNKNK